MRTRSTPLKNVLNRENKHVRSWHTCDRCAAERLEGVCLRELLKRVIDRRLSPATLCSQPSVSSASDQRHFLAALQRSDNRTGKINLPSIKKALLLTRKVKAQRPPPPSIPHSTPVLKENIDAVYNYVPFGYWARRKLGRLCWETSVVLGFLLKSEDRI